MQYERRSWSGPSGYAGLNRVGRYAKREMKMTILVGLLCISVLMMVGTAALIQWLLKS
jgi:hypothetical protein